MHHNYVESYGPVFGPKLEAAHDAVDDLEDKLVAAKLTLHNLHQQANQAKDHPQPSPVPPVPPVPPVAKAHAPVPLPAPTTPSTLGSHKTTSHVPPPHKKA